MIIVKLLFFFILCVVLKKCFGLCNVLVFILFVNILLDEGIIVLYVWVSCVIEFNKIIIFFLCLIRCFVFLIIILVIWMWWFVGLLNVEVIILFLIRCCILVIFLGCLLIRSIISL